VIGAADLRIDLRARKVTRAGQPIELTPKEFELLYYLVQNKEYNQGNGKMNLKLRLTLLSAFWIILNLILMNTFIYYFVGKEIRSCEGEK
jgi:hypothetical protein